MSIPGEGLAVGGRRPFQPRLGRLFAIVTVSVALGFLSGCAAQPPPPVVKEPEPPVVMLGGHTDPVFVQCMLDAGWESHEMANGGVIFGAPEGQGTAFADSERECMNSAKIAPTPVISPLTEEEFRQAYDSTVIVRNCLSGAGFDVADPPSIQAYIEADGEWTPLAELPPESLLGVEAICP